MSKKTFLICPVRGHTPEETQAIVEQIERGGIAVHWPPRDTDQNDPTGYRICQQNRYAIEAADFISIVWDGKSQGCLFDMGMAFAFGNIPVRVIQLPEPTEGKSFQNMIREWERQGNALA